MNDLLIHNAEEKLKKEFKPEDPNDPATMIQKRFAKRLFVFANKAKTLQSR